MSQEKIELLVEKREAGKHKNRVLRQERKIPAVVYGAKQKSIAIYVDEGSVLRYSSTKFENALFNFRSTDKELDSMAVLIKMVEVHPVSRRPLHVDFYAVDLEKPVRVSVEVRLSGKAKGVVEGGVLSIVNRTVEVECLPIDIPEYIDMDVAALGLGQAFHVSDIPFSERLKPVSPSSLTIVTITHGEKAASPASEAAASAPAKK